MVKITSPLLAAQASGTLAETITYAQTARGAIARARGDLRDAKSPAQVGRRVMIQFLTQQWGAISDADKATWQQIADERKTSPYHAYLHVNASNWHHHLAPGQKTPLGRTLPPASNPSGWNTVWVEHRIKITIWTPLIYDSWGLVFFAGDTTGFTPAVANCMKTVLYVVKATHVYYWTPPIRQTWYLTFQQFSVDGRIRPPMPEQSAAPP